MRAIITVCAGAALLAGSAEPAAAQWFGLSAGAAVPAAATGARRGTGLYVAGSVRTRAGSSAVGWRADAAVTFLPTRSVVRGQGNVRIVSILGHFVLSCRSTPSCPYLTLGMGAHSVRIAGYTSGYGRVATTAGLHAALGWRTRLARTWLFVEAQHQLIITDHGNRDWQPWQQWPVTLGVVF